MIRNAEIPSGASLPESEPPRVANERSAETLAIATNKIEAPPVDANPMAPPQNIRFSFVLINSNYLEQALANSNNQAGEVNIYSLKPTANTKSLLADAREKNELIELPGGRQAQFQLETPSALSFFFTNPEVPEEVGLNIRIL
ncbi:MAG: hypothetical protein R2827_09665 [Bdellovibrionales bacterium]